MPESALRSPENPLKQAGRRAGIEFNDERLVVNTLASHCLVEHAQAQGKGDAVIEEIFRAYFEQGADISDPELLGQVAERLQVAGGREAVADEALQRRVRQEAEVWRRKYQITGVPFFVLHGDSGKRPVALSGGQPPEVFEEAVQELL
mmetsp:Transcript_102568/g.320667  ORF Transcript_102568/g.320667 Transcript_102568/m.320667 type:complete len:148 (+) Transcript_102568:194-637(+)